GVGWLAAGGLAPGIANNYQTPPTAPTAGATAYANVFGLLPALSSIPPLSPNTFNNLFVPRGLGYGPAEVDFLRVFSPLPASGPYTLAVSDTNAATAYVNLLKARYSSNWNGGNDSVPGPAPSVPTTQNGTD